MVVPSEIYENLEKSNTKLAIFIGFNVFVDKFKPTFRTYYSLIILGGYYAISFYTYSVTNADDWSKLMQQASITIFSTQAPSRLYTFLKHGSELNNSRKLILDIIRKCEKDEMVFRGIVIKWVQRQQIITRVLRLTYIVSFIVCVSIPLVFYIVLGEMLLLVEYELGVTTPELNFWLNIILQLMQLTPYTSLTFISDYILVTHVSYIMLLVDIWQAKLQIFEKALQDENNHGQNAKQSMRDLACWHQEFCRFTQSTKDCFYIQIAVQISTSVLAISVTLFNTIASDWPVGYPIAFLFAGILFGYCALGTIFEIQQETVSDKLYEFKWYLLPVREQKTLLIILAKTQNPILLDVLGFIPLNVNLGLRVFKTIYSVMMMLVNSLSN